VTLADNNVSRWNLVREMSDIEKVAVFSGGACNIRDTHGNLLRNGERDDINDWLTQNGILFYDPQIHPDTHGTIYNYEVHQPLEIAARQRAKVNLFEVSPRTFGGATALEIAMDEFRYDQPTIIFFSDGNQARDVIPAHSTDGYPLFVPYGLNDNNTARMTHYHEFVKGGNRMRKYFMKFAEDLTALTVTFGDETFAGDIVITPSRMHAADLFRAIVQAASGQRTIVNFTGGQEVRDDKGYPLFTAPQEPLPAELASLLDQYMDEGNALRKEIASLVRINVFSRVVYTQEAARYALKDLLRITGVQQTFTD
jgi:hypothetical protein